MRATGIVRRIDELGRVVIPKEIRRTQRIHSGDALEIFTDGKGDREKIVAAAGAGRSELLGEPLPPELDALLARRKLYTAPEEPLHRVALGSRWLLCAAPVLVHGDIEGGVLLPGMRRDAVPDPETIRAAATAAEFLARWMGE